MDGHGAGASRRDPRLHRPRLAPLRAAHDRPLTRRSEQIGAQPLAGRVVPEFQRDQIREVIEGAYRIVYHIKPDQIDVLAVLHGARDVLRGE